MLEGLPGNIRAQLWLQKSNWSSPLVSAGGLQAAALNILNLYSLRSPLCTPDGIFVMVFVVDCGRQALAASTVHVCGSGLQMQELRYQVRGPWRWCFTS